MDAAGQDDYYSEFVSTLGERITVAREHAALSEAELAARLAVTTKTLGGWESDGAEPRANKLVTLAGIVGVSPTWLLTGKGEGITAPAEESFALDDAALSARLTEELRDAEDLQRRLAKRIKRIKNAITAIG